jgi:hypothetical protein
VRVGGAVRFETGRAPVLGFMQLENGNVLFPEASAGSGTFRAGAIE